jgi:hypothetical protein
LEEGGSAIDVLITDKSHAPGGDGWRLSSQAGSVDSIKKKPNVLNKLPAI